MDSSTTPTFVVTKNQGTLPLKDLPVLSYGTFQNEVLRLMEEPFTHCVNYYAYRKAQSLKFICCLADDQAGNIKIFSHEMPVKEKMQLTSITREIHAFQAFEREIAENFGVEFIYSPWAKPLRYAFNRADKTKIINNYPFYKIQGDELHEVGVGPIHAGVIEPGHFRFLCNGETVLHLEIQLGWQHRGVEQLFLSKPSLLQRTLLAESIAGDSSVSHATGFVGLFESLGSVKINERLDIERSMAMELERIGIHVGDLSGIAVDVAYQLAASVFGTLRTPVINYTQTWCGNRFGKGLIRVGGTHYPFTEELSDKLTKLLDNFEERFDPMAEHMFGLPSVLMRVENIGKVTEKQMRLIGAVGMTARMAGVNRDIRQSHPFAAYKKHPIPTETLEAGDVWARAMLRKLEIKHSIGYIRDLMAIHKKLNQSSLAPSKASDVRLAPDTFCISVVEGWRGEIAHCAITDNEGQIAHYKVKDPSIHNWMALALSLRDLEISDFPVNNKSYNLSYCGHDL